MMGVMPAVDAEAPDIAVLQARKAKLWRGGAEVIALGAAKGEKLVGHHGAYGVFANVMLLGVAVAVTKKAGHGVGATRLKRFA